jgi:hypothetical protein
LTNLSCKKFLQEKSQSDVTPVTTESYSELLFGTGYPLSSQTFLGATFYMDDDIQVYSNSTTDPNLPATGLPAFSWQPDFFQQLVNNSFDAVNNLDSYKNYYKNLSGCNIAIQYTDGTIGSQEEKDYLKGQAFALRAYYYLMLVNLYGRPYNDSSTTPDKSPGVPLILSSNLSENSPSRNSVAEVYDQISRDLDSASARLDKTKNTGTIYRINHVAAHFLASRVNLYMGRWDKVISNADYVIKYHPQLMDLNSWGLDNGWYYDASTFKPIIGNGNTETLWTFARFSENFPVQLATVCDMSVDLASQFEADDLRTQIYFSATPPFLLDYFPPQFMSQKLSPASTANTALTGCAFRSSEAYLNRAEAYAQKYLATGDPTAATNALNDLNTLRAKRFAPATFQPLGAMTPDSLLRFTRNERRRELFLEGQRWFDLRRYGMPAITHYYSAVAGTTVKYILNAHDPQYTQPIPYTALELNTNLVQNPMGPTRQPSN